MQMHVSECGAACLASILASFGRWVPLNELRKKCGVNRDGSTAASIARAARGYGLEVTAKSVLAEHLSNMALPQVLFWEWNHFLILEGFEGKWVYLNDPAMGRRKVTMAEFKKRFSGIAMHFSPRPEFQRGGVPPGMLRRIPQWFRDSGGSLVYIFLCALMMSLLLLALPVMLGFFVDRVLPGTNPWGLLSAGCLAVAATMVFALSWLKQQCTKRLSIRMSIVTGNRCVSKLLKLPIEFFNYRLVGDLTERVLSIDVIAKAMQNHLVGLAVEVVMCVTFFVCMLIYDLDLALIVLALAVLNVVVVRVFEGMRTEQNYMMRREQNMLIGLGMLMMQQVNNLRMTASVDGFFSRWSGQQARELAARQRVVEFVNISAAVPGVFVIVAYALVLSVGATQVVAETMTLGTLVAFFILTGMFLAPIERVAEFSDSWQTLAIGLQRLEDIMESEEDARFARRKPDSGSTVTLNGRLKLSGHVELCGVTFGYDRGRPPLIKDFDLVIKPGQRVAVIGSSGSGKSTLAALVSGIIEPWSGEILLDGIPRDDVPDEVIVRSLSVVEQTPFLFSANVRDNITLWNTAVPDSVLVAATRDACIHDRILDREHGYSALVDEDGGNFSGGECQRLEIARALVSNPTVLVLDEATSSLDASTEKFVDDAVRRRGISCLVVANRLSTIRDCDEIVVLEKGVVVQRGTHEQLIAEKDKLYRRLIKSD